MLTSSELKKIPIFFLRLRWARSFSSPWGAVTSAPMSPACASTIGRSRTPKGLPLDQVRLIRDGIRKRIDMPLKREGLD